MSKKVLHQFIIGASPGDAITDHALLLRKWLREDGFRSEIFAESIHPALAGQVRSYLDYRPSQPGEIVILHHSIGSDVVDYLLSLDVRFLLIYHNITPPEFLLKVDPVISKQLSRGRAQLASLRARTVLGLADSPYNERELRSLGYPATGVLPIVLDESQYRIDPNPVLLARYQGKGPFLLFVGRLVPNKRQEDLIKLLYYYRRINPTARLFLVGSPWVPIYAEWLREFAKELGLEDAVIFTGHVSQRDMVTYYRLADVYVSMSEHEGFGKPLIEAMYLGVPVLAYAAAAVPDTLGDAGVLLRHKHYEAIAEFIEMLRTDEGLRSRLIDKQYRRAQDFLEPRVRQRWQEILAGVRMAE